jgi:hypothetical protein
VLGRAFRSAGSRSPEGPTHCVVWPLYIVNEPSVEGGGGAIFVGELSSLALTSSDLSYQLRFWSEDTFYFAVVIYVVPFELSSARGTRRVSTTFVFASQAVPQKYIRSLAIDIMCIHAGPLR